MCSAMDTGDLTGRQFGPFQILSLLGAGGMGKVFRARDHTLGRDVAIKIISGELGDDPDRRIRLEREARVLASLNHPNLASIYSVETIDGSPALVLELVDGPTLADRLSSSALPIDEAIAVARQLVDALDAAHEKGIVHRDLKPANIKITSEGVVKVLDFGLAKATDDGLNTSSAAFSPTVTGLTRVGTVLGTVAYMSPEQARGATATRSADIWAFGCVVYEMLTARRAFAGATLSDTLAAVLTSEPDWSALPLAPAPVTTLIRRCLEKDTKRRLRDISDARIWLEESVQMPGHDGSSTRSRQTSSPPLRRLIVPGVALAAFAAGATIVTLKRPATPEDGQPTLRFEITPPPEAPFTSGITGTNLALSNDGSQLVYQALVGDGYQLMVRRLDSIEAVPVRAPISHRVRSSHQTVNASGSYLERCSGPLRSIPVRKPRSVR